MELNNIYELIIEKIVDNTREELLMHDEEYLKLESKRAELEHQYLDSLPDTIKELIAISLETDMRIADISYCAGIKDTLSLVAELGFFQKNNS